MTLKDISNGPDWMMWMAFVIFSGLSIVLLTGHGAWLIAGYNAAHKEEKCKSDEKKMCRITGAGMFAVSVFIFVMAKWQEALPAEFAYLFLVVVLIDCIAVIALLNTIRNKQEKKQ